MDRFIPEDGQRCWVANPSSLSMAEQVTFWSSAPWHIEMLKRGLLFANKPQAVAATKRMIACIANTKGEARGAREEETNE